MKNFISALLVYLLPLSALAGNGSGNVSAVVGLGKDVASSAAQSAFLSLPANTNERYVVSCGNGTSNFTDGNRYKCFKQSISTANTDWSIPNGTTVKCDGFWTSVNANSQMGIIWKYGTVSPISANNQASDAGPTSAVAFCTNGTCYNWSQDASKPVWHAYPLKWDNNTGSTVYPYVQFFGGGTNTVVINMLCYTQ